MLVEFRVGNYRSFKDVVTFSMVAAKLISKDKELDINNIITVDDNQSLLTSAAVYGANASGKSNLVSAIRFMRTFVLASSRETQATDLIRIEPFRLSEGLESEPSLFEIVFILHGRKYRYGFTVNSERVISEWLYYVPTTREARLFERNLESIQVMPVFKEGKTSIIELTRNNALFLSVVAQFNGEISQDILRWFRDLNANAGLNDRNYRNYTLQSFERNKYRDEIIEFVRRLDLGISNIDVERVTFEQQVLPGFDDMQPNTYSRVLISTLHRKYNEEGKPTSFEIFDMDQHESEGTKKLFSFAGPIIDTLKNGKILVVDELDARLHPLITCAIIELFNNKENNPHNAQLVFTTHDTNLLSNKMFRRDQVWFTEKDGRGATHLYSLAEYRVRNDASFEKDYISGRYGAIPFIGDLRSIIGESGSE
jgi:AAA15 family ATPase/GTPase